MNTLKKAATVAAISAATVGVAGVSLASTGGATHKPAMRKLAPKPLAGAVYRVEHYANGIGSGGVATVACANDEATSMKYVAISGGLQADPGQNLATINPLAIAASFPGRMDWAANTRKAGRLDGWVIQLAPGSAADVSASVWALCLPRADIGSLPVQTNQG